MHVTVDLHLHTTASDGRSAPDELVRQAFTRGIRVMSVTDHDTRAGETMAREAAAQWGMTFVAGIEITAVHEGRDVHVLAYGLPSDTPAIDAMVAKQRQRRVERAREIAEKLSRLGAPVDVGHLMSLASGRSGKAIARPQIADCLITAGHVASIAEAFDRFLNEGAPAYVPHRGVSPAEVVALIGASGGVASLAHPGTLKKDHLIPEMVDAGMRCLEAYHSSHDLDTQSHYIAIARRLGLAVTGGSDFHGDGVRRAECLGVVGLPLTEYAVFEELVQEKRGTREGVPLYTN